MLVIFVIVERFFGVFKWIRIYFWLIMIEDRFCGLLVMYVYLKIEFDINKVMNCMEIENYIFYFFSR